MRNLNERVKKLEIAARELQLREADAIFATKTMDELQFFAKHGYFPDAIEETTESSNE